MKLSFQNLFFMLAFIVGLFAVMVFAKSILIPLSMGFFIAFILLPIVKKLESWNINKLLSAFLAIFMMILILVGGLYLFSSQILSLVDKLNDFTEKIMITLSDFAIFINNNVNFIEELDSEDLVKKGKEWLIESSGSLVKNTFSSSSAFFTGLFTSVIFSFLLLIYRSGLVKAFVAFGDDDNKDRIFKMLKNIQRVGKQYLSGMFILIIILGFANSIGLWIIGIDNPFLFGFLAASLSIIPFVGTTIGAIIPVLYAFMTSDSIWIPIAIAIMFWIIQVIESNFLNPKIVGGSLNVNALVAILSLLIGAAVWGIAGMVLFLPFAAIIKVVCEEFDQLKPISMLISNDISDDENKDKSSKISKWIDKIKGWFNRN